MKFEQTPLAGAYLIEPLIHKDHRGFFLETYKAEIFQKHGIEIEFVQDNHARSEETGVLRGLHFQWPPHAQTKLIRVTHGAIFDVIVDLRKGSSTFAKSFSLELNEQNFMMLFVPAGFAHGYCTLAPGTEVMYKVDDYYAPECENGLIWNDPDIGIQWPVSNPILSEKDQHLPRLRELNSIFT
ncbi:dTDP-4-dehydrorhamnose 3,5-epimerase [Deltaproteobacteria bacterium TL4]